MQRKGGNRRKTRHKLSKPVHKKGKISINRYFQKFNTGDKVALAAEPAYQNGMYHPRFHGMNGSVEGMQGNCYKVSIADGGKKKVLLVHPIHLKAV